MKKIILSFVFLILGFSTFASGNIAIYGTLTDSLTGNPIAAHPVTISSDSTMGFFYNVTVLTNSNGFYIDTIPTNIYNVSLLYVRTWDCNQVLHQQTVTVDPQVSTYVRNFLICASQTNQLPIVSTGSAMGVTQTSAILSGFVNPNGSTATVNFEFGTTTAYGSFLSCGQFTGNNMNTVVQSLTNLTPSTLYHYRLQATNSQGTSFGSDTTFMTLPSDSLPVAITNGATGITSNGATIQGLFNANGFSCTASLEWGLTTSYGSIISTNINGFNFAPLQVTPNIYAPSTTVHYRASITYPGGTIYGADSTFTTLGSSGCQAGFTYYTDSTGVSSSYHFIDQSTGNITTWSWNFGDPASGSNNVSNLQNPQHVYAAPGTYIACLTVQGSDSMCYSTSCQTIVVGGGSGCQAAFSYTHDPAPGGRTINFTDQSTGNPTAWLWSFGDGTSSTLQNPVHTFGGTELVYNVCLTITSNNCSSTYCQNVYVQDSTNYHQIYGQVFAGNFPITSGLAMIFSQDTNGTFQPYSEVFPIDSNGVYYFTLVPDGNYYILAIPGDSNGYLPTYYGNSIVWQQATLIQLGNAANPYNINLVPSGQLTTGGGSASGQINMAMYKSTMAGKINMLLRNEQGTAIGFRQVTSSGTFSFASLAYGVYYLQPEMPGVNSDQVMITLTPEQPHAEITMTFSGNSILGIEKNNDMISSWSVFPNPVTDVLNIRIDAEAGSLVNLGIHNLTGKLISSKTVRLTSGTNLIGIESTSLQAGVYLLRIVSEQGINLQTKLIKRD